MVERRTENPCVESPILSLGICLKNKPVNAIHGFKVRAVAQLARASALGAEGREFESRQPDKNIFFGRCF